MYLINTAMSYSCRFSLIVSEPVRDRFIRQSWGKTRTSVSRPIEWCSVDFGNVFPNTLYISKIWLYHRVCWNHSQRAG